METIQEVTGYALVTKNGSMLCRANGMMYISAFPMSGDVAQPFMLCRYRSGAESYAREWNTLYLHEKRFDVKPVKVVIGIIKRSQSEASRWRTAKKIFRDELKLAETALEVFEEEIRRRSTPCI